jgi:hypothetical protein
MASKRLALNSNERVTAFRSEIGEDSLLILENNFYHRRQDGPCHGVIRIDQRCTVHRAGQETIPWPSTISM